MYILWAVNFASCRGDDSSMTIAVRARVVHESILCDPIQPNQSADWLNLTHPQQMEQFGPNPIQRNTTSSEVFYTKFTLSF